MVVEVHGIIHRKLNVYESAKAGKVRATFHLTTTSLASMDPKLVGKGKVPSIITINTTIL